MAAAAAAINQLADVERRVDEVKALYATRTRSLLASLHTAQAEAAALREAQGASKRGQYIAALQGHLRERELVVDVLKQLLGGATGRSAADVDQLLLKKTVGGPQRFRPKSREELGLEVSELEDKLGEAARALGLLEGALKTEARRRADDVQRVRESASVVEQQARELAQLDRHARELEASLSARDERIAELGDQLEALGDIEDKARRVGERYREARDALGAAQREVAQLRSERDRLAAAAASSSAGAGGSLRVGFATPSWQAGDWGGSTFGALDNLRSSAPSPSLPGSSGTGYGSAHSPNADVDEAGVYVQRLRVQYGREIAELRGALETLRGRMQAAQEQRDAEAQAQAQLEQGQGRRDAEALEAQAVAATEARCRRAHDAELAIVRRELDATLRRLHDEHADDLGTLAKAHARELEQARSGAPHDSSASASASSERQRQVAELVARLEASTAALGQRQAQLAHAEAEAEALREAAERQRQAAAKAHSRLAAAAADADLLRARLADRDRELDQARSRRPSNSLAADGPIGAGAGAGAARLNAAALARGLGGVRAPRGGAGALSGSPAADASAPPSPRSLTGGGSVAPLVVYGGGPPPLADGASSIDLDGPLGADGVDGESSVDDAFALGPSAPIVAGLRADVHELRLRVREEAEARRHVEEYLASQRTRADDELAAAIDACSRAELRADAAEAALRRLRGDAGGAGVGGTEASASRSDGSVGLVTISDMLRSNARAVELVSGGAALGDR